jgi:hypothetical protein
LIKVGAVVNETNPLEEFALGKEVQSEECAPGVTEGMVNVEVLPALAEVAEVAEVVTMDEDRPAPKETAPAEPETAMPEPVLMAK